MCTAVAYNTKNNHLFGRNLDIAYHNLCETVTIMPRNYVREFRHQGSISSALGIVGMAYIMNEYPLYYDAMNEVGLGVAALNFPIAKYTKPMAHMKFNIASFEVIPWILSNFKTVDEVKSNFVDVNITDDSFTSGILNSPLHWMVADKDKSIVIEQTDRGLRIHDNPVGVMTNSPTFDIQMFTLNNYRGLSINSLPNTFSDNLDLAEYSYGMGALGMPGDWSSTSRFVRAAFTREHSQSNGSELDDISQFFHILKSVEQPRGCNCILDNEFELTVYSSCCNLDRGIYYYTTYNNPQITAVNMHHIDLQGTRLRSYLLDDRMNINYTN